MDSDDSEGEMANGKKSDWKENREAISRIYLKREKKRLQRKYPLEQPLGRKNTIMPQINKQKSKMIVIYKKM